MFEAQCFDVRRRFVFPNRVLGVLEGKGWIIVFDMIPNFMFISVRYVRLLA